ncbi:glycyl-radical enzyme activating protein [Bacteroidota bacterium]
MPHIFDIKRFALHDGPGIRTTVFFKGCPMQCVWCHNPESHDMHPEEYSVIRKVDGKNIEMKRVYGKEISNEEVLVEMLKDQAFYDKSGGGVTFSGGEPLFQHKSLIHLLIALGKEGIHRAVDTSGYTSREIVLEAAEHTELFLYDLKIMDADLHKRFTGIDNRVILENAELLMERGAELIIRIPVIPGINDTEQELAAFTDFLSTRSNHIRQIDLLPYHSIGSDKYRRMDKEYELEELTEPTALWMEHLKGQMKTTGVPVSIGG